MARYFRYFPKTFYIHTNNTFGGDFVTNIITRFKFEESLKENSAAFYSYQIKDSDTPEIIAGKYYNDPERHWIVLLFNDIIDPQFDWPLESDEINRYINKKYTANGTSNTTVQTGLTWSLSVNNVQAYFKVITTTGNDGTIRIEKLEVNKNTYANVAATTQNYVTANNESVTVAITKETRSYYDYEIEENEKKREIKLLKNDFVDAIEKEFKRIIAL